MAAIVMAVNKNRTGGGGGHAGHGPGADQSFNKKMAEVLDDPTRKAEDPVARFQRFVRERFLYAKKRLHRGNLAERLQFEAATTMGLLRFFNQLCVFALFVAALSFSSNQEAKRGILETLDGEFDFESFSDVARRDVFVRESMVVLSDKSKEFFILSNKYFDDQGIGSTQLVRDITSFTGPTLSAPIDLHTLEFSLTTWVKVVPQFVDGYIVRKRLVPDGAAAELSCWGWYLSRSGPGFHYGCHDFFKQGSTEKQAEVALPEPTALQADQFMMLTLVVEQNVVHFWRNEVQLSPAEGVPLPRPVTDCFNAGEGLLVGAGGMELSLLRFHPRKLQASSIQELYQGGSLLADISTGSQPMDAEPEGLQGALSSQIEEVKDAVHARQEASEVTMVLKKASEELASPPAPPPGTPPDPVDAPLGQIQAASNPTPDPLTGKEYYRLAYGPYRLSPTSEDADHRSIVNLPDASGKGFTLTWWYRHMPCDKSTCGIYLFSARDDERICYAVWLETVALWFENALGTPSFQYPQNFMEDQFELNDDFNWRHMAMVWDETNDEVRYYVDGKFAVSGPWGSAVTGADCTAGGKFMTFGRYGPFDYTYGADVDMFDFRQYIHDSGPLSDADILAIASADTPELNPAHKCLPIESPQMADSAWKDTFGHDCEWFFKFKDEYPALCDLADTSRECPVACGSRQQCLNLDPEPPVFVTWDRIRRVDSLGSNGTICLSSSITTEQVKSECEAWAAAHVGTHGDLSVVAAEFEYWADSLAISRRGRRVNLTSCEELVASIDPECAFDDKAVKDFTKAVKENGGDWTIAFWIRPTGQESQIPELGHFYPHVQFLAKTSPPQHNLAIGLWANPFGEVRVFSDCDRAERDFYDNVETSAADDEGWTMITISRNNANDAMNQTGDCTTVTNIGRNWEGSQLTQCLYDPDNFMKAIEINYPSLISPIMMIPKAISLAEVQRKYFQSADALRARTGPIVSHSARVNSAGIEIDKRDYSPRSILMAPPIIFQTKTKPADKCPFTYSTTLIEEEHAKMAALKCADPFECPGTLIQDKFQLYACPGDAATERVFGLEAKDFNGQKGYADFLYSLVDHPILSRDGMLKYTEDFIDSRTEMAQVILVFFTPDAGTTSVMTVTADFSGYAAAAVDVSLQHYEILEGDAKWLYLAMQVLVMVNLTLMAIDIFFNFKTMVQRYRKKPSIAPTATEIVKQLIDFGTIGMCVAFIVLRIPQKFDTAPETERIVGGFSRIPWDSTEVSLEEKTETFFGLATDLLNLIGYEQNLNRFCNVILIVSLLRVVQCTNLHPRLALLTGTIAKSFDDMWHSCILVVLLMGCFAGVATWRFGSYRADFGNFEQSMQTQFEMLFGEFPDDWTESRDMQAYTVLYIMIMFLLIQNFLLAIIVEAYMKVREFNEKMKTHQEISTDVVGCFNAYFTAWRHGWPTPGRMGLIIRDWEAKFSVCFKDVYATGEFKDQAAAAAWMDFYHRFDFLEPEEVGRYGYEKEDMPLEDKLESRVARVMGKELPLRETAQQIIANSNLAQRAGYQNLGKIADAVPAENNAKGNGNGALNGNGNGVQSRGAQGFIGAEPDSKPPELRAELVHSEGPGNGQAQVQELQGQVAQLQAQVAALHRQQREASVEVTGREPSTTSNGYPQAPNGYAQAPNGYAQAPGAPNGYVQASNSYVHSGAIVSRFRL